MKKILSKTLLTIKATALIAVFTLTHQKSFATRFEICTKPVPNPKTIHELYSCKRLLEFTIKADQYIALSKDYIKKNISEKTEKITLIKGKKRKTYNMPLSKIKGYVGAGGENIDFNPAFLIRHQKNQKHILENVICEDGFTANFGGIALSHFMSKAEVFQFLKYSKNNLVLFKAKIISSNYAMLNEMITDQEQYEHFIKEAKWAHLIFE